MQTTAYTHTHTHINIHNYIHIYVHNVSCILQPKQHTYKYGALQTTAYDNL